MPQSNFSFNVPAGCLDLAFSFTPLRRMVSSILQHWGRRKECAEYRVLSALSAAVFFFFFLVINRPIEHHKLGDPFALCDLARFFCLGFWGFGRIVCAGSSFFGGSGNEYLFAPAFNHESVHDTTPVGLGNFGPSIPGPEQSSWKPALRRQVRLLPCLPIFPVFYLLCSATWSGLAAARVKG